MRAGLELTGLGLSAERRGALVAVIRRLLASSDMRISSRREFSACEISGLMDANVRDLSSVPYRCLTSLGRLG